MKNILITLLLIISFLTTKAQTFVPDDIFEQRLIDLGYDDFLDNFVDTANINTITGLGVGGGVEDFTGLEDFTALEVLDCSNNFITTISFSTLVNLKELEISSNPFLNSIDISDNILLEKLTSTDNNIESIDTSNNINLIELYITNSGTALDLTNNIALEILDISLSQPGHDISNNVALKFLDYSDSNISSLNITNNPNLETLRISNNSLSSLNTSNNTNLKELSCYFNNLTNLDLSNNVNLEDLDCEENNLINLTLGSLSFLKYFFCSNNNLTNIDVTGLPSLEHLNCERNQLSDINLLNNINLLRFEGGRNLFTEIDTSNNIDLWRFSITSCNLVSLDMSNNPNLQVFACGFNAPLVNLNIRNGNNQNIDFFVSLGTPNLKCIFVDNTEYSNENWTYIGDNNHFVETQEQCDAIIGVEDNTLDTLNIYPNPVKDKLIISNNFSTNIKIEIFNILGKSIIKQQIINNNQNSIDISNLDKGIYILQINTEQGSITKKIIKS